GATRLNHLESARDVGHTLGFAVHATDSAGTTTAYAALLGPVAAAGATLVSTGAPAISGAAAAGQTLQVSSGSWSQPPSALGYQWQRCNPNGRLCTPIAGATKPTYTQGAKDVGHTLGFAVHATDSAGTSTAYAALLGPVAAANAPLASTAQPAIAGTAAPGQALQASGGSWSQPPSALGYQWQRCNANGRLCAPIDGATASTYTAAAADTG